MGIKAASVRLAFGAIVLATLVAGGCSKQITDNKVERVALKRVARYQASGDEGVLIIDARRQEQFNGGHIPGARNIRLPEIDESQRDPRLEKFKTIVVYGDDPGSASAMAMAKRLMSAGYKNVHLFEAGFSSWQARGLPISRGE